MLLDDLYRRAAQALHAARSRPDFPEVNLACWSQTPGPLGVCYRCESLGALAVDVVVETASAEIDRLHSWTGLMELLDEHWPEDIFPTLPDDPARDPGPRIVSLIRHLARLVADNTRLSTEVESWRQSAEDLPPPANYVG